MIDTYHKAIEVIYQSKYMHNEASYVQFAFDLIDNGIDIPSIYVLAGLQFDSLDDKVKWFYNALRDLNISLPSEDEIHTHYAKYIINETINHSLSPTEALSILYTLWIKNDYYADYGDFVILSDSIDLLEDGDGLAQGMDKSNINDYVIRAMELYIIFKDIELPDDFYNQAYCAKCGRRSIPRDKNLSIFPWRRKLMKSICPFCKHDELFWTHWNKGKELYLKEIRNCV